MKKILMGILIFVVVLVVILAAAVFTPIVMNDVPLFKKPGVATRLPMYLGNNVVETSDDPTLPELQTPVVNYGFDTLVEKVNTFCEQPNWQVESVDQEQQEIHIVITTPMMKYKDDLTLRMESPEPQEEPTAGQASEDPETEADNQEQLSQEHKLHIRSASRVGKGDLGANLGHILKLKQELGIE